VISSILYLLGIPVRMLKFLIAYIVRVWKELRSIIGESFDYQTHHHHHHHRHHHNRWTAGPLPEQPILEKTRIAFCTTCKGRLQHLMQTIPANLKDNASYRNLVFVVVDYGGQDKLAEFCSENYPEEVKSGRLVVYTYPSQEPFKMAHAKNMAHRLGMLEGADVLVNADADNFMGPDFAKYIAEMFEAERDVFLWARMIPGVLARGINGRIAVSAKAFLNAGGYDERFETWSRDDKDFNARLRKLGYDGKEIDVRFLNAVRHTDKMRFREYPHAKNGGYEDDVDWLTESDITVANFGNFGRGIVVRNLDEETPICLDRVPTRIFGIGMHKTGTTSLHAALEILGIDSAHWVSAHWAKAIWCEVNALGKSETMERHYALCDLPIPQLYIRLDQYYPGSKFILTIRDEEKWLESARRHWSREHNKFRSSWDTDPFTHTIHKAIYGRKQFDAEIFLARYRAHNAGVLEHFKYRPQDLFILNMEDPNWEGLCRFLGRPVPNVPYPRKYVTGS
jgi:hypothetical protein